jgi:hypothetical protein
VLLVGRRQVEGGVFDEVGVGVIVEAVGLEYVDDVEELLLRLDVLDGVGNGFVFSGGFLDFLDALLIIGLLSVDVVFELVHLG